MTKEEKQLLLVDLCSRLPYKVKVLYMGHDMELDSVDFSEEICMTNTSFRYYIHFNDVKPYLRPLSSMTEEEERVYSLFSLSRCNEECFDWLNAHHFDYRGLINKGLALEAPADMYK